MAGVPNHRVRRFSRYLSMGISDESFVVSAPSFNARIARNDQTTHSNDSGKLSSDLWPLLVLTQCALQGERDLAFPIEDIETFTKCFTSAKEMQFQRVSGESRAHLTSRVAHR